jgi:two-component system cell cycle sensor histidine kinase/response regulator CckA
VEPEPNSQPDLTDDELLGAFNDHSMILALLECALLAIISVDNRGRIALANRLAVEMFGYTRRELVGTPVELLLPAAKRAAHGSQRQRFMEQSQIRPMGIGMDLAGCRKDGTEFPIEIGLSHLDTPAGKFAIAFISDISKRKELEDQLLHAQKLEAVGRLAGGVAHDFNNMLTVISGYNRMILDEVSPMDSVRGYAEEILKASDRAAALTNQLLSFSRRQTMRPRPLSVNVVLVHTEKMLRRLIGEDIELVFRLSPENDNIYADANQIEQVIVNLVVNARDAMPEGGRITIETETVSLDESYVRTHLGVKPGEYVMIAVSDTGHGMDAETKRRMFEPFFTTKPQGKGTGLGLATAYGAVKQTGGDIWVYSEPGQGTTFKLYFPRVSSEAGSETGTEAEPSTGGTETILLVEDEDSVRNLTLRMLNQLGYTVISATDGKQGIEIAKAHSGRIDLLLTDVVMPNISGRQLVEMVKAIHPETAIVFISGYTEDTVVYQGVLQPGVEFLSKPFTRESLAVKLREAVAAKARKA